VQYLVEGARGPLPASPEQAVALLEGTVIPHFEHVLRLKAEGKILAGGVPVGDRAFVFIIEAASNDEADRIVRDMPAWGLLEWKVTPLQSVEARARRGSIAGGTVSRDSRSLKLERLFVNSWSPTGSSPMAR
jgi:hypothetical protein